jgi:WD40 repeat protein
MQEVPVASAREETPGSGPIGRIAGWWSRVRCLIDGLKVAWVSVASAVIGLALFLNAPPAQDLFLEGKGDPVSDLLFWGSFYLIVILFWALPVFISARWILASFEEGTTRTSYRPFFVAHWVRGYVPPLLAVACFAAVLTGQLMALHNSPTVNDQSREEIVKIASQRIERAMEQCTATYQTGPIGFGCVLVSEPGAFAMSLGESLSRVLRREYVPMALYGLGVLVALWLFFARPSKSGTFFITKLARKFVVATIAFLMVAPIAVLLTGLIGSLVAGWTEELVPYLIGAAVLALIVVVLFAWWGWDGLLWWLGTLSAIPAAALVLAALLGFILIELEAAFGLAHLILLPATTALVGIAAWRGLKPRPAEQATRIGHILLRLTGHTGAMRQEVATVRLVNPIFYVSLTISAVMILACIVIHPLVVTSYLQRALLLPIILGLPVAALTYITYWSARWHAPLVPAVVGLVAAWGVLSGSIWEDIDLVRQVESAGPRPPLDRIVKQWESANNCERGAEPPSEKACPSPIIVAAAGGASRSAFHVAGVIGTLLDEQRFSPLRGHGDKVRSAAFSPDGLRIVTASDDRTARIWNARTGRAIGSPLEGHAKQVNSAAFSPDGTRIVTASDDQTARIWDATTGRALQELKGPAGHTKAVRSAAFSPDGARVVTASDDRTARIWDAATGRPIGSPLEGHNNRVNSAAFSPDGTRIVTAAWDRHVRIWDAQSGKLLRDIAAHSRDVNAAVFSPDGTRIASVSDDGTARAWDAATGEAVGGIGAQADNELKGHADWVLSVAFSPVGRLLVTASRDRTARIWTPDPDQPPIVIKGHSQAVTSAAFSPDGTRIVTASEDGTARVWDAKDGQRIQWDVPGRQARNFANRLFAISAVSGGALGAAVVYAALADSQRAVRRGIEPIKPPCTEASVHDADWYAGAGDGVERREPHKSWRDCLQVLTAGDFLSPVFVSLLSNDLFNIDLRGSRADVLEQAWETRYARITGASEPERARSDLIFMRDRPGTLAEALTGIRPRMLERNPNGWLPVLLLNGTSVATGRRIVTSDVDTWTRDRRGVATSGIFRDTYDLHELFERHSGPTLKGHARGIQSVAVLPDGRRAVTGSEDSTARVWDTEQQTEVGLLIGHSGLIRGVASTPDGSRIVTGSGDKTARVWEPATDESTGGKSWRTVAVLSGHTDSVHGVAISTDGQRIVTGSYDDTARVWEPGPGGAKDWQVAAVLKGHAQDVNGVAMTPDGSMIVTGSDDTTARVWRERSSAGSSVKDWQTVAELKGHKGQIWSVAVAADGHRIATGSQDGTARVWEPRAASGDNAEQWQSVAELAVQAGEVSDVAVTADGSRIVTGSTDSTARVWQRQSGGAAPGGAAWQGVATLKGHSGRINGVAVTPDGTRIVTGAKDATAHVWAPKSDSPPAAEDWRSVALFKRYTEPVPRCKTCDIRLSTAVTMSARFPIVSPAGTVRDRAGRIVDRVVDGGYYENFGATTAQELADALRAKPYGLKPVVLLINNEPEQAGMECEEDIGGPTVSEHSATPWFPTISSPLDALLRTRTARGTHAAVNLCAAYQKRFAHVRVKPDPTDSTKALSMSWWMSKHVQKRLDEELDDQVNVGAFDMTRQ